MASRGSYGKMAIPQARAMKATPIKPVKPASIAKIPTPSQPRPQKTGAMPRSKGYFHTGGVF